MDEEIGISSGVPLGILCLVASTAESLTVLRRWNNSMVSNLIPANCVLRSSNPDAVVTSPHKGLPAFFNTRCHTLDSDGLHDAVKAANYQTAEMAFSDVTKHPEIYLGDRLFLTVDVDEFGNPGVQTWPEYAIRHNSTVKALLTTNGYPRHQAAQPCHLTEECIMDFYFSAIAQGVPFSWTVIRPKFEQSGDILFFWPSHMPAYGAAAADKLGTCVDLSEYTPDRPFSPKVIHVAMPWLSEQEFGGVHAICVGSGRKRMLVVNGGPYDGGTKKPITFQLNDRELPKNSMFVVMHWAITMLVNAICIAIGNTTAAGKSEGSSPEEELEDPGLLTWIGDGWSATVNVMRKLVDGILPGRKIVSDDITAVSTDLKGLPVGAEVEPVHFYRIDLYMLDKPLEFIKRCAEGKVKGRIYYYNVGFNKETRRFEPHRHEMLGSNAKCTNSRVSYGVDAIAEKDFVPTAPDHAVRIDCLVISVPAPAIPEGWHMPTILRLTTEECLAQFLHGARANKGNPALGAVGNGYWAFEGYAGKSGFSLDTEAEQFARDLKFWQSLSPKTPCFLVFNGHSMGAKQKFKYSGTYLLRFLLENWYQQFLNAPLLKVPGVFTGGVPDLRTFLSTEEMIDPRVWNPEVLDQAALRRDADTFDFFACDAANRIMGQTGLTEDARMLLGDLVRKFTLGLRASCRRSA